MDDRLAPGNTAPVMPARLEEVLRMLGGLDPRELLSAKRHAKLLLREKQECSQGTVSTSSSRYELRQDQSTSDVPAVLSQSRSSSTSDLATFWTLSGDALQSDVSSSVHAQDICQEARQQKSVDLQSQDMEEFAALISDESGSDEICSVDRDRFNHSIEGRSSCADDSSSANSQNARRLAQSLTIARESEDTNMAEVVSGYHSDRPGNDSRTFKTPTTVRVPIDISHIRLEISAFIGRPQAFADPQLIAQLISGSLGTILDSNMKDFQMSMHDCEARLRESQVTTPFTEKIPHYYAILQLVGDLGSLAGKAAIFKIWEYELEGFEGFESVRFRRRGVDDSSVDGRHVKSEQGMDRITSYPSRVS